MSLKNNILHALKTPGANSVSGEALAESFDVSRAAVWKAVRALRAEGYEIEATTNRGYRLLSSPDILTPEMILPFMEDDSVPLHCHRALGSTNSEAMRLAIDGAPHRTVVLAEEQSAGRGRRGRSFFSPARSGLYMSLILRPEGNREHMLSSRTKESVSDPVLVTVAAAVAVCKAIEALTPCKPKIKWVNDILLNEKKVCGILTEVVSDLESASIGCLVVGVGVNISTPQNAFPEELRPLAVSLDRRLSRGHLAAEIANRLFGYFEELSNPAMLDEYRSRSIVLGRVVRYVDDGHERTGQAVEINERGNLVLESKEGISVLHAGEISLLEHTG